MRLLTTRVSSPLPSLSVSPAGMYLLLFVLLFSSLRTYIHAPPFARTNGPHMTQWGKCAVALVAVSMLHVCSAELVARPAPSSNWRPEKTEGLDSKVYDSLQLLNEMQSVYIGRSEVQGVGLFASRTFEQGETVMRFTYGPDPSDVMHWVPFEVVEAHLSKEQAAKVRIFWAHNETHTFVPYAPMMVDALQSTFFVHYLNHAHKGEGANIAYEMPDGSYRALRRVTAGEELLIDYRNYCPECYKLDIKTYEKSRRRMENKRPENEEGDL